MQCIFDVWEVPLLGRRKSGWKEGFLQPWFVEQFEKERKNESGKNQKCKKKTGAFIDNSDAVRDEYGGLCVGLKQRSFLLTEG